MPTISSVIMQLSFAGVALADDHLGRAQHLVVPEEPGAHLLDHGPRATALSARVPTTRASRGSNGRPAIWVATTRRSSRTWSRRRNVMRSPSCQLPPRPVRRQQAIAPARAGRAGQLQRRHQPVAQVDDVQQQWPQRRPRLFPRLGPRPVQFLLQRGLARLQGVEDAAELIQRLLHQTGFGAHLAAQRGHLDQDGEQVCGLPRVIRRLLAVFHRVQITTEPVDQRLLDAVVHRVSPASYPAGACRSPSA